MEGKVVCICFEQVGFLQAWSWWLTPGLHALAALGLLTGGTAAPCPPVLGLPRAAWGRESNCSSN